MRTRISAFFQNLICLYFQKIEIFHFMAFVNFGLLLPTLIYFCFIVADSASELITFSLIQAKYIEKWWKVNSRHDIDVSHNIYNFEIIFENNFSKFIKWYDRFKCTNCCNNKRENNLFRGFFFILCQILCFPKLFVASKRKLDTNDDRQTRCRCKTQYF